MARYQASYGERKCPDDFADVPGASQDPVKLSGNDDSDDEIFRAKPDEKVDEKKTKKRKGEQGEKKEGRENLEFEKIRPPLAYRINVWFFKTFWVSLFPLSFQVRNVNYVIET